MTVTAKAPKVAPETSIFQRSYLVYPRRETNVSGWLATRLKKSPSGHLIG